MNKQAEPYPELEKEALEIATTDIERCAAIKALRTKLEERYGIDEVEQAREQVIEKMDEGALEEWVEIRSDVLEQMEGEILLMALEILESEPLG